MTSPHLQKISTQISAAIKPTFSPCPLTTRVEINKVLTQEMFSNNMKLADTEEMQLSPDFCAALDTITAYRLSKKSASGKFH
ncbi:MAG: hypothetical protein WDN50_14025 [Bradyrhizobium sp.]